jgi:hypothetical protein
MWTLSVIASPRGVTQPQLYTASRRLLPDGKRNAVIRNVDQAGNRPIGDKLSPYNSCR